MQAFRPRSPRVKDGEGFGLGQPGGTGVGDRRPICKGRVLPKPFRSPPEPLAHFLELYAVRRFWASHEALEEEWVRTRSDFYQGLILYASAWVHWERKNAHGVRAQSVKALNRFDRYPSAYLGFDVDALRAQCIDLRDTVSSGLDAWGDLAPMSLAFDPDRVLGTEAEFSG